MTSALPIIRQSLCCLFVLTLVFLFRSTKFVQFGVLESASITTNNNSTSRIPIPRVLTLHYKTWYDERYVEHNCVMASRAGAQMMVYTEKMNSKYCEVCECRRFVPANCPPPNSKPGATNHCEKLIFFARMIPKLDEFIYLDADTVVMDRRFFRMFAARAQVHDFLATYAEGSLKERPRYVNYFNSGMLFIRNLQGANYSAMVSRMYKFHSGFDQSILSGWVHENYDNWDTLPFSWMCRRTLAFDYDIPAEKCLTIHDRAELKIHLRTLNKTLLKV